MNYCICIIKFLRDVFRKFFIFINWFIRDCIFRIFVIFIFSYRICVYVICMVYILIICGVFWAGSVILSCWMFFWEFDVFNVGVMDFVGCISDVRLVFLDIIKI